MLTCRDISTLVDNLLLTADNKMLATMCSAVSHDLITPIKCII